MHTKTSQGMLGAASVEKEQKGTKACENSTKYYIIWNFSAYLGIRRRNTQIHNLITRILEVRRREVGVYIKFKPLLIH